MRMASAILAGSCLMLLASCGGPAPSSTPNGGEDGGLAAADTGLVDAPETRSEPLDSADPDRAEEPRSPGTDQANARAGEDAAVDPGDLWPMDEVSGHSPDAASGDTPPVDADVTGPTDTMEALDMSPGDEAGSGETGGDTDGGGGSDTDDADASGADAGVPCTPGEGSCQGLTWTGCDPETRELKAQPCAFTGACATGVCMEGLGCVLAPLDGQPCDDGDACTGPDLCGGGVCQPGPEDPCEDGNPCTLDLCIAPTGCISMAWDPLPCSDGDPCTSGDHCVAGACLATPIPCPEGQVCEAGACICPVACAGGQECGLDPCGSPCGTCAANKACAGGLCQPFYPPPPYGGWTGQTAADLLFVDPATGQEVWLHEYWGDGRVILLNFSSGWCIVCKNDTAYFNAWHSAYHDAGLRIVEILYENPDESPISAGYALGWKQTYGVLYDLWMDQPGTAGDGTAQGGALANFLEPAGPVLAEHFPVPLLLCPATMEILFVDTGLNKTEVLGLIQYWLFQADCAAP